MPTPRTIAIGDIHGCALALGALLEAIQPGPDDTIITLGDYVDRGSDSNGVITQLLELRPPAPAPASGSACAEVGTGAAPARCRLVTLMGNHEDMMLRARGDDRLRAAWFEAGGQATLESYDAADASGVPAEHWKFINSCTLWFQTPTHFFVHACYAPEVAVERQTRRMLLWPSLNDGIPDPHVSGKIAVVGHTPQKTGQILDLPHIKCIDTDCCRDGWLTALEVNTGQLWQANDRGMMRTP